MASRFYLELYRDDIPQSLNTPANAPAVQRYQALRERKDGVYWALVMPRNQIGDDLHEYVTARALPGGAMTHGTDLLPSGTSNYLVDTVAVLRSPHPPYDYKVTLPGGDSIELQPSPSAADDGMAQEDVPIGTEAIGIWVVEVSLRSATRLPSTVGSAKAQMNPDNLPSATDPGDDANVLRQPLLRLDGPEAPPKCPTLEQLRVVSGCAPGQVDFEADITGAIEGIVSLAWHFGDGTDPEPVPLTLATTYAQLRSASHTYPAPAAEPFVATLVMMRDDACSGTNPQVAICTVASCNPPVVAQCPHTVIDAPRIEGCNTAGQRPVNASATLPVRAGDTVSAELRLEPAVSGSGLPSATLQTRTGEQADFTLSGGATVPPGQYKLTVNVTEPLYCGGASLDFTVPGCAYEVPPGSVVEVPPSGETGGGGGGGTTVVTTPRIPWCLLWMIGALAMTVVGGILFAIGWCAASVADVVLAALVAGGVVSSGMTDIVALIIVIVLLIVIVIGFVMMVVGTILLLIWLFTCGSCRTNCDLLRNLHALLVTLIALEFVIMLIFGLIAWILSLLPAPICGIAWLISLIDLALLDLAVYWYGTIVGCFSWPSWVPRWLRLTLPDPMRFVCKD